MSDESRSESDQAFASWERLRAAWDSVQIVRPVSYGLFTFGESLLQYYVVVAGAGPGDLVGVRRGEVRVTRPRIFTSLNAPPELRNFFPEEDDESLFRRLLSRTARFQHLQLDNQAQPQELVSDQVEEIVAKLQRRLDAEDEDRVAILTAPAGLGGLAVLKYALDRIVSSTPENLQELWEHGLLP